MQGTLDVGERVLKPGDVMITEPGVPYGPHTAGPQGCDLTTVEGMQKMQELMGRGRADKLSAISPEG